MAMIFIDGFDHYAVGDTNLKYGGNANTFGSMQTGLLGTGQCARLNGSANGPKRNFATNYTTFICGVRLRFNNISTTGTVVFQDASSNAVASLCLNSNGSIAWYRGNSSTQVVASASGLIIANAINYIEMKVTLATGATGSVDIHLNGTSVASTSSVQTANTTASTAGFNFQTGPQTDFDDFYFCDNTGSQNNNFLGDVKVVTVMPNGNGRVSQWTRTGGTASGNYTAVNETTPDGDTSYVSTATAGNIDAYALGSAGSPTNLYAVQINTDVRKDDAGTRTVAHGVGNGTTENFDAGTNIGTAYAYLVRTLDTNPLTSAAWATGDLSTLQSAIKLIA